MTSAAVPARFQALITAHRARLAVALLVVGALGLAARLWVSYLSHGSNDINTWGWFAADERLHGVGWLYDHRDGFNHPPLMVMMAGALHALAEKARLRFDFLFKLPSVAADLAAALLIHWRWRRQSALLAAAAFALFCWNPASFLVTAHHGNTDPLCATLSLLAGLLVDRGNGFAAGLALGGAVNVKLIPVLLLPALLSALPSARACLRFAGGLALGAVPFIPVLIGHWPGFYRRVLAYRSFPHEWGITSMLASFKSLGHLREVGAALDSFWIARGSLFILAGAVALAAVNRARHRAWDAPTLAACVYLLFILLAPGFGLQYLIYPIPLLFVVRLPRAVFYSTLAGAFMLLVYYSLWTGGRPYYSEFREGIPAGAKVVGNFVWLLCATTIVSLLRRRSPGGGGEYPAAEPSYSPRG
ncbi:MAG TPA: glycosyltransferase 87 family protein [Polyangia bacterium]|nr:glycosyltransferase 87 family protein [Polyangia bacterium]